MKKLLVIILAVIMILSFAACGGQEAEPEPEQTPKEAVDEQAPEKTLEPQPDWEYDEGTKTLYVYADMGAFEPDAPDEAGTTTNAPWSESLQEIENIVVGEGVTYIGDYSFAFCNWLRKVEVAENATALDFRCFYKCGDLEGFSELRMTFYSNDFPMFGDDVFGYTWDNPNVVVEVPEGHEQHWVDYLGGRAMQIAGYNQVNLDDPNSIASIFLNDLQFKTGGTPDVDMQEDFSAVAIKKKSDDNSYVEFGSDGDGAYFTRNESLLYDSRGGNQAVMFKFMPNDTENLVFTIMNDNEISMKFVDGIPHHVNMHNVSETPYSEYGPANITLQTDKWYWVLMAVDGEGNYRSAIWQEDDPMIGANCTDNTGISGGEWKWNIGFGANQTLYLSEYIVFDFDSINDGNTDSGAANGEGLGPQWQINIGGNFDIMSDMVWQSVELQDINAGGDTFKGYGLKEMMEFSGNGSDSASITFGQEGAENEQVEPTYDAYIVFKKNDEFLGGPYLLSIDGLSEHPVTEVHPN